MTIASPGLAYASERLLRMAFPKLAITPPAPGIRFERDVAVSMRDGTRLRLNLFRPEVDGKFPTIMSAHPYGKDALPRHTPIGYLPRYLPPARYRFMRQPRAIRFSAFTTWEAPDPSFWVQRGYAVVNLDLRGFGTSDGTGALLAKARKGLLISF